MQRRLAEAMKEFEASMLGDGGKSSLREAALRGGGLPPSVEPFVAKIRDASFKVTDDDIAALKQAGLSEDEIFEITVAAAVGASADAVAPALALLGR